MSKKLKGQVKKDLETIAQGLPVQFETVGGYVLGFELARNPKFKKIADRAVETDKEIFAGRRYHIPQLHTYPVNHFTRLKKVYEAEGRKGVLKYILPHAEGTYKEQLQAELDKLK